MPVAHYTNVSHATISRRIMVTGVIASPQRQGGRTRRDTHRQGGERLRPASVRSDGRWNLAAVAYWAQASTGVISGVVA
jgi:hypothetical protein